MQIFDKITSEERSAIEWYVKNYADWNTHLTAEQITRYWSEYKNEYLFNLLGKEIILSKKVTYNKDMGELEDEIDALFWTSNAAYPFIKAFKGLTCYGGTYADLYSLDSLLNIHVLASNIWDGDSFEIPLPNGKSLSVNHGCKVSRILGKIATELNLPGYEEFRIAHSQVLNQKTLTGTLYLSIHPLDYMTMSDNDCGWSSCMSWADEGEYRRGTVEMMNSPCVVVAYLANPKDAYNIQGVHWSNKKWRELFVVTPEVITGIKGYPYQNTYLETIICDWLRDLAKTNLNYEYHNTLIEYAPHKAVYIKNKSIIARFMTGCMYNDFGSRSHLGYFSVDVDGYIDVDYSGPSMCMRCGQATEDFDTEGNMVCCACDDTRRCDECGDRHDANYLYELDGYYYCEYCYNNIAVNCASCNTDHHCNDMTEIYLARTNPNGTRTIYTDVSANFCPDCFNKFAKNHLISEDREVYDHHQGWHNYPYVLIEDCAEETIKYIFNFDSVEEALNWQGFTDSFITVSDI